jgi:uncharacterized protein (UPF0332 family)
MAFNPLRWLELAAELGLRDDEAALRTAVGRAYYAVWLATLASLVISGRYESREGREDHRGVIRALRANRRGAAANHLQELARLRETADYEQEAAVGSVQARRALELASRLQFLLGDDWSRK